ncbi:15267_t:CDS:2, partial [Entrophospora sp. SA101]
MAIPEVFDIVLSQSIQYHTKKSDALSKQGFRYQKFKEKSNTSRHNSVLAFGQINN